MPRRASIEGYQEYPLQHKDGVCSHSGRACRWADRCTMTKRGSCARLLMSGGSLDTAVVRRHCKECMKRNKGKCTFICVREIVDKKKRR